MQGSAAKPLPPGAEMLRVENLSRSPLPRGVNLAIRAGEIVGMAGLIGAGRTELCRALFGLDPIETGPDLRGGQGSADSLAARCRGRGHRADSRRTGNVPDWRARCRSPTT